MRTVRKGTINRTQQRLQRHHNLMTEFEAKRGITRERASYWALQVVGGHRSLSAVRSMVEHESITGIK